MARRSSTQREALLNAIRRHDAGARDFMLDDAPQGFTIGLRTPPAPRMRALWEGFGKRIYDSRRMFGPYIDVLEDQDFALQKDPLAHTRMMRDGQIRACVRIRQLATASRRVEWSPRQDSEEGREVAKNVSDCWSKLRLANEALVNILDAIPKGSSFQELIWDVGHDFRAYISRMIPLHKDRFVYSLTGKLAMRTPDDVFYGEEVAPYTVIHHMYDPEPASYTDPAQEARVYFGQGEFDRVYPWFQWKQIILQMALRFAEGQALPFLVGRYPYKNKEYMAIVEELVQKALSRRYLIYPSSGNPDDFNLEWMQAPTVGWQIFELLLTYIDNIIAKVILGSTLVLEAGEQGSYGLGKDQSQHTFGVIAEHDSRSLCDTLENTIGKWYCAFNHWDEDLAPICGQTVGRSGSMTEAVETALMLADHGYPISVEVVSDLTGMRPARKGETLLKVGVSGGGTIEHGEGSPLSGAEDTEQLGEAGLAYEKKQQKKASVGTKKEWYEPRGVPVYPECWPVDRHAKWTDEELASGTRVEMEHTDDPKVAKKIALDHLREDPRYYTKLKKAGLAKHENKHPHLPDGTFAPKGAGATHVGKREGSADEESEWTLDMAKKYLKKIGLTSPEALDKWMENHPVTNRQGAEYKTTRMAALGHLIGVGNAKAILNEWA